MLTGMNAFDKAFEHTVGIEGGYSNNPADLGGPTKYGITERVARAAGYQGDMKDMPIDIAKAIYRRRYWDINRLDAVATVSESVALEMFDTGVNCGTSTAGLFLQRSLNVLNRQGKDFADLLPDGSVGPMTVEALSAFVAVRGIAGHRVLLTMLNCLQGAKYIEIAERYPSQETFVYGWVSNRVSI
jgi:lysozyme family protein